MATQEIGWKSLDGSLHADQQEAMIHDVAGMLQELPIDAEFPRRAAEMLVARRDEVLQALTVTKNPAIKPMRKKRRDAGITKSKKTEVP